MDSHWPIGSMLFISYQWTFLHLYSNSVIKWFWSHCLFLLFRLLCYWKEKKMKQYHRHINWYNWSLQLSLSWRRCCFFLFPLWNRYAISGNVIVAHAIPFNWDIWWNTRSAAGFTILHVQIHSSYFIRQNYQIIIALTFFLTTFYL